MSEDTAAVGVRFTYKDLKDPSVTGIGKYIAKIVSVEQSEQGYAIKAEDHAGNTIIATHEEQPPDVGSWAEFIFDIDETTSRDTLYCALIVNMGLNFDHKYFNDFLEIYKADPLFFDPRTEGLYRQ
eukprot:UN01752